jgi:hypothetical protein
LKDKNLQLFVAKLVGKDYLEYGRENNIKMYVQNIDWYIAHSILLAQETDTENCDSMKGEKPLCQMSELTSLAAFCFMYLVNL